MSAGVSAGASPGGRAGTVLLADDDRAGAAGLAAFLRREGYEVTVAEGVEAAPALLGEGERAGRIFDVVLLGGAGEGGVLDQVTREHRATAAVVIASYATVESAVFALRRGACDYLVRPLVDDEVRHALSRAMRERSLKAENVSLRRRLHDRTLEEVVGGDARMARVFELVRAVAPSRTTVLMTGESGTGKSLIAHAIHRQSPRKDRPFVELSCGSIPETLLESELFGHAKGAFTGAHADKVGRFAAAEGGTIFLDEINSASPAMQLKLLRVLQERRFEPVGSTRTVEVDVRVVLASNQALEGLVASGAFRQDLYYRINVVAIDLPPLRERVGDIAPLATHFLARHAADLGRAIVGFTPAALDALRRHDFPGNVRELQNIIERAAVLTRGQTIDVEDLPTGLGESRRAPARAGGEGWTPMTLEAALREPERRIILAALAAHGGSRQKTSEALGINRTTLYKRMRALGLLGEDRLAG